MAANPPTLMLLELSHSLNLDEEALARLPEETRPIFVLEWLRFLDKVLPVAHKSDIRGCQQRLVSQLLDRLGDSPGPPTRHLIASNLATLFVVGEPPPPFAAVDACLAILRSRDDTPTQLPTRLGAIRCLGTVHGRMGRSMGRSREETVAALVRTLRNAESQTRIEVMMAMARIFAGPPPNGRRTLAQPSAPCDRDAYKAARQCLGDRNVAVRAAAAECLLAMAENSAALSPSELESLASLCLRSLEGASYEARLSIGRLLGFLVASTQMAANTRRQRHPLHPHSGTAGASAGSFPSQASLPNANVQVTKGRKAMSLEEALGLLMAGFLRSGVSFLKGDIIKGSPSPIGRDVRVGVTHAYVETLRRLGGPWLSRNLGAVLSHVLELVSGPKAASSHVDAVHSRRCVAYLLRSTLGHCLGEAQQVLALMELTSTVRKHMEAMDPSPENAKESNQETLFGQHLLVCALQEMGSLLLALSTSASTVLLDAQLALVDTVVSVLLHPCQAPRLAAAWCLRCVGVAVPSQVTPLIDRCVEGIESMRTSPEAISGYGSALAAILGGVQFSPLGIPHTKGKVVFNTGEELLRSASQNSRLSLARTQTGWLLMGAVASLGVGVVRGLLPRLLLLWRNSFPRSARELDSEKARGDAFTWQVTLEGRAGALSAMHSFLLYCPELATEDVVRRLLSPVESALAMVVGIAPVVKSYGQHLKAPVAMVRLRLYETLSLLPPQSFEGSYAPLLRMLVGELTLSENPANTTTSLLLSLCHSGAALLLGRRLRDPGHRAIEDQLQPNSAAGSGALEHDPCCLYGACNPGDSVPGPLPLGVAVIDAAVRLFGRSFPHAAHKHRLQVLAHFSEVVWRGGGSGSQGGGGAKGARGEALTINCLAALLAGLTGLAEDAKGKGGAPEQDDLRQAAASLALGALPSPDPLLRVAAAECLGRLAQAASDPHFTARLAQASFDRLKVARDAATRTGHSLALGCLHRRAGAMAMGGGSGGGGGGGAQHHLRTSVGILLALAGDHSSQAVQVWSLHALSLMADSGGPMFRGFVEPSLALALRLLLRVPSHHDDVYQCVGRLLSALVATMGPELQGNGGSVCTARSSFLCACAALQLQGDPLVEAEAINCLQQLHLFAPRHLHLSTLVPTVCRSLCSEHRVLRRSAVSCLRQLAQREAAEVCRVARSALSGSDGVANSALGGAVVPGEKGGLPTLLFRMLDWEGGCEGSEEVEGVIRDLHDTIISMLQALAPLHLSEWLHLCKRVLTVAPESGVESGEEEVVSSVVGEGEGGSGPYSSPRNEDEEEDDDSSEFRAGGEVEEGWGEGGAPNFPTHYSIQPRWPTRTFAARCVRQILEACERKSVSENGSATRETDDLDARFLAHFDMVLAKKLQASNNGNDFLVLHLSDLVRMSFIAATSDSDALRLEGLHTLHALIDRFASIPEPGFPGHVLLEQYQAQVGAALRPAFSPDTPPHVTAAACRVCSAWIGSGVARDLNDLRRVHLLLVSSLGKLHRRGASVPSRADNAGSKRAAASAANVILYNESMGTLEKLSILKAWAEVYIVAVKGAGGEGLLALVQPELGALLEHWMASLRDHALLSLPPEFGSQLPHDGGSFYTSDTAEASRMHYSACWPPILHAAALGLEATKEEKNISGKGKKIESEHFHLLFGICMESLCGPRASSEPKESVMMCLHALQTLLSSPSGRSFLIPLNTTDSSPQPAANQQSSQLIVPDKSLAVELCNVLHRLVLTREWPEVHALAMEVLTSVLKAGLEAQEMYKRKVLKEISPANQTREEIVGLPPDVDGEVKIAPGQSLAFALLEVCLCLLLRYHPHLAPNSPDVPPPTTPHSSPGSGVVGAGLEAHPVSNALNAMRQVPRLCSHQGAVAVLPTILYLCTGVLGRGGETSQACLQCLEFLCCDPYAQDPKSAKEWSRLLQSALAKVLDLISTAGLPDKNKDHEYLSVLLTAFSTIALKSPPQVAAAPVLCNRATDLLKSGLKGNDPGVRLECMRVTSKLFSHPNVTVSTRYMRGLTPTLLEIVCQGIRSPRTEEVGWPPHDVAQASEEKDAATFLEGIAALEAAVAVAVHPHKRQLFGLLIPSLITCLLEGVAFKEANHCRRLLHEQCLKHLMRIGPQYPQEFKSFMSFRGDLRQKLEAAIRSKPSSKGGDSGIGKESLTHSNTQSLPSRPTIQLKTDFSNFTS
ncbi:HEAT repeat-containing protein 5B [Ischnura elegans]|uniref:HEAT repeat-containing protein 5B n=1 Tax=Ischnura elegans TaxID=197161 RepID=UPI001ED879BF|nr:HEAT repeat-containing protein 5B [Ischnura elegans]